MYWYDLALLTITCLAEIWLLCVCISRRVRAVWLIGGYSFVATLGMMLVAEHAPGSYIRLVGHVDKVGNVIMALVFVGLMSQLWSRRWIYLPVTLAYIGLLLSQIVCALVKWQMGTTTLLARLEMGSWLVAIVVLTLSSRLIPRDGDQLLLAFLWRDLIIGE